MSSSDWEPTRYSALWENQFLDGRSCRLALSSTKSSAPRVPEALAYVLIPPTANLANYKNNGPPQSWDACMFSIVLHHGFQAEFWLQTFGELGKANPTQLEQSANDRMARYLGGTLGNWVIEVPGYRQYCSYFGTPDDSTPAFVPTPTPSPSVFDNPRLDISTALSGDCSAGYDCEAAWGRSQQLRQRQFK